MDSSPIWPPNDSLMGVCLGLDLTPILKAIERVDWPEPRPPRRTNPYFKMMNDLGLKFTGPNDNYVDK